YDPRGRQSSPGERRTHPMQRRGAHREHRPGPCRGPMIFAAIPANAALFVDANTFVYHFSRHPVLAGPCHDLLDRIYRQQLAGFTSSHVLSDVAHRLMTLEAATTLGWTGPNIAKRLRRQPAEIQKL